MHGRRSLGRIRPAEPLIIHSWVSLRLKTSSLIPCPGEAPPRTARNSRSPARNSDFRREIQRQRFPPWREIQKCWREIQRWREIQFSSGAKFRFRGAKFKNRLFLWKIVPARNSKVVARNSARNSRSVARNSKMVARNSDFLARNSSLRREIQKIRVPIFPLGL